MILAVIWAITKRECHTNVAFPLSDVYYPMYEDTMGMWGL